MKQDVMNDLRATRAPWSPADSSAKMIGALLIAVLVALASFYTVTAGVWNSPRQAVTNSQLPSPTTPVPGRS
jgi:hypothetical protein